MTAPILIFGWGNPSRGDDAVGPLFVERIEALGLPGVECLTDFQLQVEHALDLQDRQRVLFVDASLDADTPFTVTAIEPRKDTSFTTHTVSPQSVLQVYCDLTEEQAPPTWLLAVRGERFELGEPLSVAAESRLAAAIDWLHNWLANPAGTPL